MGAEGGDLVHRAVHSAGQGVREDIDPGLHAVLRWHWPA